MQRTTDFFCMLKTFSSANQFRRAALFKDEIDAFGGYDVFVGRLNGKISRDGFVERRLGCNISLIG